MSPHSFPRFRHLKAPILFLEGVAWGAGPIWSPRDYTCRCLYPIIETMEYAEGDQWLVGPGVYLSPGLRGMSYVYLKGLNRIFLRARPCNSRAYWTGNQTWSRALAHYIRASRCATYAVWRYCLAFTRGFYLVFTYQKGMRWYGRPETALWAFTALS